MSETALELAQRYAQAIDDAEGTTAMSEHDELHEDETMAVCPSCKTTYEGRDGEDGVEGYDPLADEWITDCARCGCPNLEWETL